MSEYNGYPSWNQWNVSLWINNDEFLYRFVINAGSFRAAYNHFMTIYGGTKTPDGAIFNALSVRRAIRAIYEDN